MHVTFLFFFSEIILDGDNTQNFSFGSFGLVANIWSVRDVL